MRCHQGRAAVILLTPLEHRSLQLATSTTVGTLCIVWQDSFYQLLCFNSQGFLVSSIMGVSQLVARILELAKVCVMMFQVHSFLH